MFIYAAAEAPDNKTRCWCSAICDSDADSLELAVAAPGGLDGVLVPVLHSANGLGGHLIGPVGGLLDRMVDGLLDLWWGQQLLGGGLLLLSLLGVAVEEQVDDHGPLDAAGDGAAQTEHFTGQQPPHQTDGVGRLVVARNGNVDVAQRRIGVREGNHGDVHVAGLHDGLVIGVRVGHHQQTGLAEGGLDLVGEGTGGEAASDGSGVRVLGELQHGALADGTRRDDEDLCGHINLLAEALAGGD